MAHCAKCYFPEKLCRNSTGKGLPDCPTENNRKEIDQSLEKYETDQYSDFSRAAAMQEGAGYSRDEDGDAYASKTRLEETIEFCKRRGYKKLGLAFCIGLQKEASVLNGLLEANGFEVVSVVCKVGRTDKEQFGIDKQFHIEPDTHEVICNPIAQSDICNAEKTDFNIVLGLCVGHDSMFLKNSNAFCTVFAVKDRVLAHNPLGAIYNLDSYYKRLKKIRD